METRGQPQNPGPGTPAAVEEWVIDADARTFEKTILERSLSVPVIVDFWATWCGPCKILGPELEKRARAGNGRFLLAKVDIDRSPELAQAFRVQSVPTVLAILQGRLVDAFQGAIPAEELDQFLERIAPAGPRPTRHDALVERARALAEDGQSEQAIGLLRELLRDAPEHVEARLALVELLIDSSKAREARLVLEKVEGEAARERVEALRARLDFAEGAGDLAELEERVRTAPDDLGARIDLGRAYVAAREYARGLEELLHVIREDPADLREQAKKAMLEVFAILGLEDKVANEYRFKLSLELFA